MYKTNNMVLSNFVNDTLTKFYPPKAVRSDKVLLMLSGAVSYMVKFAQSLLNNNGGTDT